MEVKRTSVTSPLQGIVTQDSAPNENFVYYKIWVHPFIPHSPPSNVTAVHPCKTHFHPPCVVLFFFYSLFIIFCSKFNIVWGGRGKVAICTNINGKVPILLTPIHVDDRSGSILKFIIMRQTIKEEERQSLRGFYLFHQLNFKGAVG